MTHVLGTSCQLYKILSGLRLAVPSCFFCSAPLVPTTRGVGDRAVSLWCSVRAEQPVHIWMYIPSPQLLGTYLRSSGLFSQVAAGRLRWTLVT
jgi:hypothetical protein